jgi:hypothetical protein
VIERVAAPEHSPPDQQGATCILVLGHVLAESRQHREVRTSLGEVCGYWNDEIALVRRFSFRRRKKSISRDC